MEKIVIDDFAKIKYLSNPTFSKNGKVYAYNVSESNLDTNSYDSYIYLHKNGKDIKLTNGKHELGFFFLDDTTIVFQSDRKDSKANGSKFYKISIEGGEAELALEFPINVSKLHKLKNNDFLVLGSFDPKWPDLFKGEEDYIKKAKEYYKENEDYEFIEENPWWWNGSTFTRGVKQALYLYSEKTKKLELLSSTNISVNSLYVSQDEKYIYFSALENKPKSEFDKADIYAFDLSTKKSELIISHKDLNVFDVCFLDNEIILIGNKNEYGMNTNPDFYKYNPNTKEISLKVLFGEAIGSSVGSDVRYGGGNVVKVVGDTIYFTSTIFDSAYLYSYNNGIIKKVIDKEGSIDSFDIYNDKFVMVALYDMCPQELYNEQLKRVTSFNTKFFSEKDVVVPETFNYMSNGKELHGFVLKPTNFEAGKKYPAILDIHGGPKTVYGKVFYHEMQLWANMGYFVVYTNPTGSDGRGNEFADIRGKYGTIDYTDLMTFVDEVIRLYPQIDSTNFFETGGSYGGFMTNWIIGHTNRFKACASQRSISNWVSFYGISDIGIGFSLDQQASSIFDNVEKLWFHSPLKYAGNVKTPTLFIHSECDYRCPSSEGMQMYTALVDKGVDTKLVYFKGENHDLSRTGKPKHRIKRLSEITNWFLKYTD